MFGPDKCGEDKKVIIINNIFDIVEYIASLEGVKCFGQEQKYRHWLRG